MMSSEQIQSYFNSLEAELERCIKIAKEAKMRGEDPSPDPEILLAKDLAGRVESLVGIKGVAQRIRELESEVSREEVALHIGLDFAEGKIGSKSGLDLVDGAIRTAVAILTEGIVAAPIEGIARVGVGKNDDGSDYLKIYYSGPIRSAGGTAQALSVLVADYVRRKVGISEYKPRIEEVERYAEEVLLYKRITNLQYTPSNEEIRLIVNNCPICIDGEPTEEEEVSAYRNLDRIETNRVRGGMVLVLAEGLALKAPKVKTYVEQLGLDGWEWLDNLIIKKHVGERVSGRKEKFLEGIIAGRPVFSHPSAKGGFRLRYGRSRNSCYATAGIHPATMNLLDDFIATGTQMKVELPGKAVGITPVDTIEGPTVRLVNGDVLRIDSVEQAHELRPSVAEIIDVGEILINYGDFLENAHPLVPASYCYEWWIQELEEKNSIREDLKDITPERAFELSEQFDVPLHPKYTYLWHDITISELDLLANHISEKGKYGETLTIPVDPRVKEILETLLIPHKVRGDNIIVDHALPLIRCLGLDQDRHKGDTPTSYEKTIEAVSAMAGVRIRERAPIRIGGRMGRPEKSEKRKMHPPVHVLFPTGGEGSRNRSLNGKKGEIEIELGIKKCPNCGITTFKNLCDCGGRTFPVMFCVSCGISSGEKELCPRCGRKTSSVRKQAIDFSALYARSLERLGERAPEEFKGVLGLTSKNQTPEPLEKGILRAKNGTYVFKDGTIRYDITDLPLTHFRPREIGISLDRLSELGYCLDMDGKALKDESQVVELKPQDVILSKGAGDYLLLVANFLDELLVKYYGMDAYYNIQSVDDLIGKLVIGLAPHTSAGVLGRIVGFTSASVCYAHPFFHAAKRRNCDGDEDCIMLLMDGLLNFSLSYLPDKRGGKMDAPIVLTTRINPSEIDSEVHNIDLLRRYPLEFYEASLKHADPKDIEVKMDTIGARLGSSTQYEGFYFTHDTSDIAAGPMNSAYKTLGTMIDKMEAQLTLAKKIRAVDARDVAERVIVSHFLPDLIGNLRAFSKQKMRCVKCNARIRRPPLRGTCPKCGGKVILTVHEGSIRKYLDISLKTAEEYDISNYTKQRLRLIELEINSLFASDKVKQAELVDFM
ncbi:MAG: DNA polymerase II large subunit [Methanocellales archaeon]|nr:DNA polymerase II large subunit [Methanocellales archaeon]MDD3291668.1 DNA polymerase II large subunit [Methanocellales archaeon]MDD5485156.1 DNA polymerase II large subunit [Methanocellales archaeon]